MARPERGYGAFKEGIRHSPPPLSVNPPPPAVASEPSDACWQGLETCPRPRPYKPDSANQRSARGVALRPAMNPTRQPPGLHLRFNGLRPPSVVCPHTACRVGRRKQLLKDLGSTRNSTRPATATPLPCFGLMEQTLTDQALTLHPARGAARGGRLRVLWRVPRRWAGRWYCRSRRLRPHRVLRGGGRIRQPWDRWPEHR